VQTAHFILVARAVATQQHVLPAVRNACESDRELSHGDPLGSLQGRKDRRAPPRPSLLFAAALANFLFRLLAAFSFCFFAQLNAKQVHRAPRITLWKVRVAHSENSTVATRWSSGFALLICLHAESRVCYIILACNRREQSQTWRNRAKKIMFPAIKVEERGQKCKDFNLRNF
jgi:hypothetical protein